MSTARECHACDFRGFPRMGLNDDDSLFLPFLPEIELDWRPGVISGHRSRDLLWTMQMTQSDIMRGAGKSRCGHRVRFRDMDFALASTSDGSINIQVWEEQVHGLWRERSRQRFGHSANPFGVILIAIGLGIKQPGRVRDL